MELEYLLEMERMYLHDHKEDILVVEVDNWDKEMVKEHMCLNDHIEDLEEDLVGFDMDLEVD